jgi:hypothetical protein
MSAVTWYDVINGFFGACRTCAATLCAARFTRGLYVCHLAVRTIMKYTSDTQGRIRMPSLAKVTVPG